MPLALRRNRAVATSGSRRTIALAWRRNSPREEEFRLLGTALSELAGELVQPQ